MADCDILVNEIQGGDCPEDQASGATCLAGNTDMGLGAAWDEVKDVCGQEPADGTDDRGSDKDRGDIVREVLSTCAQNVEGEDFESEEEFQREFGSCIDSKIISGEEGEFQLTDEGREALGIADA